jgi:hypothetical protein
MKWTKWVISALAIFFLATVLCILFAVKMENNTASIVGGALSALATVLLGAIAFYQNSVYQKDTNKLYDMSFMPEFYRVTTFIEILQHTQKAVMRIFYINPQFVHEGIGTVCGSFFILRGPLCNLVPKALYVDNKCFSTEFIINEFSINAEQGSFKIDCLLSDELMNAPHDYAVMLEYENMYGMKYSKKIRFRIEKPCTLAGDCILDRATRAD